MLPNLPVDYVLVFLELRDRINLAKVSRELYRATNYSLEKSFDRQVSYGEFRRSLFKSLETKKGKKHLKANHKGESYLLVKKPVFEMPSEVFFENYTLEAENTKDNFDLLKNTKGDMLLLHKAILNKETPNSERSYEWLAEAEKLNYNVDFENQAVLLRRQKLLLETAERVHQKQQQRDKLELVKNWGKAVVILCQGGSFAVVGFSEKGQIVCHSSESRYVSRKKQGGRQLNKDKHSKIQSAGSSIRRENERVLAENIEKIIKQHTEFFEEAAVIFLHAPGLNYFQFGGKEGLLKTWEHKLRPCAMNVAKAKYTEAEKVFKDLTYSEFYLKITNK